ncbi:hypothetical protein [Kordiimonas aquimaris]|uniref:hypothetical protein n=1 Tax=Kordiimonas aquimaris TaxID=707591 RepID=UPI0021D08550|nr:hypothetical protein [Kordiimonas aquimaris]
MQDQKNEFQDELNKPRIGFLITAAILSALSLGVYFYEADIVSDNSALAYSLLLITLVLAAMFFMLCYRVPRIGNRLLGYHKMVDEPDKSGKSDVQFSAGFKQETAADKKRMNTQRKQARYSRRKLAAITREMNQEKSQADNSVTKPDSKTDDQGSAE